MKHISSRDNPFYKELKSLAASSQARRKAGRTVLDGIHLAQSYLQHRGLPLFCVVSESALGHAEVAAIVARCDGQTGVVIVLPDSLFAPLSQVEHGVEVLLVIATPESIAPANLEVSAVLLDNLQDPGNLGSILRSAAAAGIRQVYCSCGTASAWSPKVLRAAMGGHFLLDIVEQADLAELLRHTRLPVLATSSHAVQSLYQTDLRQPLLWLFGHEGQGVAEDLLALASQHISIPHAGDMESLNVAAAAAVCFFEQVRQQQA
ncbi:RNA methyltransferase [Herbaspirillum sp. RTI4]|uniref:TrmH family RNA methyltransferase n=1 Tax=Herbaspirillum sp. RTI4 TaxID=3048640 RepID=UPI002AB46E77|nr:RNA methyltransferase [Herbaspirillum sp. RTI4]MDY7578705.1 RNA methyltransferase [Herbaspirillum sp. RTI4]MEA9980597.1 RNA methyltransferase [Herbaspirillum sp. RTI4]